MFPCLFLVLAIFYFQGCATLSHLEELLTMKALSDNQTQQEEFVLKENERFEKLLDVIKGDRLGEYPNKESFLQAFGEPIFSKERKRQGKKVEEWLYRYAARLFDSDKVYLYFDESGKLVDFDYVQYAGKKQD